MRIDASKCKRLRIGLGLTQQEFADRIGIGRSNYGFVEHGRIVLPHPTTLRKIAAGFDVKIDDLLISDEPASQPTPASAGADR